MIKFIRKNKFLARPFRELRDFIDNKRSWVKTPFGFEMRGNKSMELGKHEESESKFILSSLPEVDVLVNVGANIGYYCLMASNCGIRSIAFEPVERNLRFLKENVLRNNFEDLVEIFPMALGDKCDIIKIYGERTGASVIKGWADIPENYYSLVAMNTLDNVLNDRLNGLRVLVILDVEGFELPVLKGALKFLSSGDVTFLVEVCTTHHQPKGSQFNPDFFDVFKLFASYNYRFYGLDDEMVEYNLEELREVNKNKSTLKHHNFVFKK
jgi:FkbM family methyltransferase